MRADSVTHRGDHGKVVIFSPITTLMLRLCYACATPAAFGLRLGYVWATFGLRMGYVWATFELRLSYV